MDYFQVFVQKNTIPWPQFLDMLWFPWAQWPCVYVYLLPVSTSTQQTLDTQDTPCGHIQIPKTHITHWGRDKINAISQTTFSNAFSWMKMYEFHLRFDRIFFPKVPINNIPAMVQIMAWRRSGDKPLFEPMMFNLLTHICVTRPQWVNGWQKYRKYQVMFWITWPFNLHKVMEFNYAPMT